jgi:hypothetical protein
MTAGSSSSSSRSALSLSRRRVAACSSMLMRDALEISRSPAISYHRSYSIVRYTRSAICDLSQVRQCDRSQTQNWREDVRTIRYKVPYSSSSRMQKMIAAFSILASQSELLNPNWRQKEGGKIATFHLPRPIRRQKRREREDHHLISSTSHHPARFHVWSRQKDQWSLTGFCCRRIVHLTSVHLVVR